MVHTKKSGGNAQHVMKPSGNKLRIKGLEKIAQVKLKSGVGIVERKITENLNSY